jgi:pyruvate/2-oxoglutarate dehydrogenase complex dihydrolipoamide acyltransferase (E2) component
MKATRLLRLTGLLLTLGAGAVAGSGEEPAKAPAKESTANAEKAKPADAKATEEKSAEAASVTVTAASSTNAVPPSPNGLPAASSALLDLSTRETAGDAAANIRQTGPEPVIKEPPIRSLDERGGALRYLAKEPKPGNLLQLINPFAPMSLGQGGRLVNEWSPMDGVAPVPRGFRNEGTHEPMSILLGWP